MFQSNYSESFFFYYIAAKCSNSEHTKLDNTNKICITHTLVYKKQNIDNDTFHVFNILLLYFVYIILQNLGTLYFIPSSI